MARGKQKHFPYSADFGKSAIDMRDFEWYGVL